VTLQKYVVYYRVSTKEQGDSGLGLDAQRAAVEAFLTTNKAEEVPPSFTEIESGKNNDRPELRLAVDRCKQTGSTLLIAKLDRLSRNVAFIFNLKAELESAKVDFKALDLPEANTLMLGVMASMEQHERELISRRTKEGLRAAVAKGVKLGNPQNLTAEARAKAHAATSRNAREDQSVRHAWHFIQSLRTDGMSYAKIALRLNEEGYRTRTGKLFHPQGVLNIYNRFTGPA
jgi:DNA invertase Pin-like site-specific DNA recombinase